MGPMSEKELSGCFLLRLLCFPFPPAVCEGSISLDPLPTLVIVAFFYFSHSDECEVVAHCASQPYFPGTHPCQVLKIPFQLLFIFQLGVLSSQH